MSFWPSSAVAELLLDGLHLLAQIVVALRLLDLVLDFGLDLVAKLLDFELFGEVLIDALKARGDVGGFEQLLLVGRSQERQRRGDEVDQPAGLLDIHGDGLQLVRERGRSGDDLLKFRQNIALQRLDLRALFGKNLRNGLDRRGHERLDLREHAELDALGAFGEDEEALVGHFDDFMDGRERAVGVQIARLRRIHARVALGDDDNGLFVSERLDELDGAFAAHRQGQHGMGE